MKTALTTFLNRHLRIKEMIRFILVQKPIAQLFGPYFKRGRVIEIDITYSCNLKCYNCNRSCGQAPTTEKMTVDQIKKFIAESISSNFTWDIIRVLGGEPTIHPNLIEILNLLLDYKKVHSPKCQILLITNGYGEVVKKVLEKIPTGVIVVNTEKKGRSQWFTPFNLAPRDLKRYRFADFSIGCNSPAENGIGLNAHGYYSCGPAAGMDRVFGFDVGRKQLPAANDELTDHKKIFCKYCGHFTNRTALIDKEVISPSWRIAYKNYEKKQPKLSLY